MAAPKPFLYKGEVYPSLMEAARAMGVPKGVIYYYVFKRGYLDGDQIEAHRNRIKKIPIPKIQKEITPDPPHTKESWLEFTTWCTNRIKQIQSEGYKGCRTKKDT